MTRYLIFLLTCLTVQALSQNKKTIQPLTIGDSVPDITIRQIIGSNRRTIRLADLFKKGPVIIDFWASWCAPCIEELPVADTIAGRHPELSIVAISHDDSAGTAKFLKSRNIPHANIIVSSDDKLLSAYFKHRGIPHNVWIDRSGIVRLTTAGYAMNEAYVSQFIKGIIPKVRIKKPQGQFRFWEPYHVEDSLLHYRSVFTKYNDTLPGGAAFDGALTSGKTSRVFIYNQNITRMYWLAFSNCLNSEINWKAVELHTRDSTKFFYPEPGDALFRKSKYYSDQLPFGEAAENWAIDNSFCYDLIFPNAIPDTLFSRYMFEDLNRFFNVRGTTEKRTIEVSVIRKSPDFDTAVIRRFIPDGSYRQHPGRFFKQENVVLTILDRTLEQIIAHFIMHYGVDPAAFPLVNETGIDYPVAFSLNFEKDQALTYEALQKLLAKKGLVLTRQKREVPVLVIYDNN